MRESWSRWVVFVAVLAVAMILAVAIGTISLSPVQVWNALLGRGDPTHVTVVRELRLPRAFLAALVGAGLGMSGAALQGTLRNPLAEPYLLGVSGGAAVGAVVGVALGIALTLLPLAAFAAARAAELRDGPAAYDEERRLQALWLSDRLGLGPTEGL